MNLHSDKEAFKEIIALAAEHFGYEQSHVEKDYWVSKILRDISLSEYADKTYFKGGTSLSKAYGLIERFSEDLDLFVFTGNMEASKQAEKTLNKKLSKYIIEQNNVMTFTKRNCRKRAATTANCISRMTMCSKAWV